jgi:hypothetical protein
LLGPAADDSDRVAFPLQRPVAGVSKFKTHGQPDQRRDNFPDRIYRKLPYLRVAAQWKAGCLLKVANNQGGSHES